MNGALELGGCALDTVRIQGSVHSRLRLFFGCRFLGTIFFSIHFIAIEEPHGGFEIYHSNQPNLRNPFISKHEWGCSSLQNTFYLPDAR
jgi:hypothetical protein